MRRFHLLKTICLVLLIVLTWQSGLKTAGAHANIARAEPGPDDTLDEPPSRVVIWFTEPIEEKFSEILVFAADGSRVDNGNSQLLPDDPMAMVVTLSVDAMQGEGNYTVSWKNVSTVDGHIVRSSYVFSVGRASGIIPASTAGETSSVSQPLEAVIRWLVLLSIAGIFGGLCFDLFVVRPALARFGLEAMPAVHHKRLSGRVLNLIWFFIGLFLLASGGQILIQSFNVNGTLGGEPLIILVANTYWGRIWTIRMGLFLVLFALVPLSSRLNPDRPWGQSWERPREVAGLFVSASIMLALSMVSHAAATTGIQFLAVVSDFFHLLAAGAWAGGLLHFAWNTPYILRQIPKGTRRSLLATMVPRFSILASLSVAVLILTGLFSSYAQVTILAALDTSYGRTLLVKLVLIMPLLALGAVNLLWIGQRLTADVRAGKYLGRTVRGEAALAVLVLLVVGFLVIMEPARQVASREVVAEAETAVSNSSSQALEETAEGVTGRLMVDTAKPGEKRIVIELFDRNGEPLENASDVIMTIAYPKEGLEPFIDRPINPAPGRYEFETVPFSVTGEWHVEILVVRPDAFDTRLSYVLEVGGENNSAGPVSETIAPDAETASLLFGVMVFILLGVVAAVIFLVRQRSA